jgi:hypothetical protein
MDDILTPINNPATQHRLRWFEIVITNKLADKSLKALAELQPVTDLNEPTKDLPIRFDGRDIELAFDVANPKHLQLYQLLEEVVRQQYEANSLTRQ